MICSGWRSASHAIPFSSPPCREGQGGGFSAGEARCLGGASRDEAVLGAQTRAPTPNPSLKGMGANPNCARYAPQMPVPDRTLVTLDPLNYHAFLDRTRTDDILLCSGTRWLPRLIRWSTASEWSHIAMVVRVEQLVRAR